MFELNMHETNAEIQSIIDDHDLCASPSLSVLV